MFNAVEDFYIQTSLFANIQKTFILLLYFSVPGSNIGAGILSDFSFKSLEGKISEQTMKGIEDMGFTHMTEIQAQAIPHLLEGRYIHIIIVVIYHRNYYCKSGNIFLISC